MTDIANTIATTAVFEGAPEIGATFSGELEGTGDVDFIAVTLTANKTYRFFGSAEGVGAGNGDSYLRLLDSAGNAITSNDNDLAYPQSENSLFTFKPTVTGTYFVDVHSSLASTGSYSIAVTAASSAVVRLTETDDSYAGGVFGLTIDGDKGDDDITIGMSYHALGEQGDDIIHGNGFANFISGGLGNDSLDGGGSGDSIFGDAGFDIIVGGSGDDSLYGGDGGDYLTGQDGQDTIRGGEGGDQLIAGNNDDSVFGEDGDDELVGEDGNDLLDGGSGADTMRGFLDDDTYFVDNSADVVLEAATAGLIDLVYATVNYTLLPGSEIEMLVAQFATSTTALDLAGNEFAQDIVGNNGANALRGGGAADTLEGLLGNDTYVLDDGFDKVFDTGGVDTITSTISRSLANHAAIERLTLTGTAAINGAGNKLANVITGNGAANALDGGLGNDSLNGGAGKDILKGGAGNDKLDGGAHNDALLGLAGNDLLTGNLGKDVMMGGAGNDVFRFAVKSDSLVGGKADVIKDFDDFGNDRIDVSGLFGPHMTYRHDGAFTAAGQVRVHDVAGPDVLVEVNTGGSLAADFAIRLAHTTLASMSASDFIL